MEQSTFLQEWRRKGELEGELEGWRISVVRVLEYRFKCPPPDDVIQAVNGLTDLDELGHWLDIAVSAESLDAFREAVQQRIS